MKIEISKAGCMPDGQPIISYKAVGEKGFSVDILNLGGIIRDIRVPDEKGNAESVVCGFDRAEDYLVSGGYFGALVGRCANRIGNARFELGGKTYRLLANNGKNHLHGGKTGLTFRLWNVSASLESDRAVISLHTFSEDMEDGYPGNLGVQVVYTVEECGRLTIRYTATTDADTVVNLTNHSYFNLGGLKNGGIEHHRLTLDCDRINCVDEGLVPTGEFENVAGTPYDFRKEKELGRDFASQHPHMIQCCGYDTNFCAAHYDGTVRKIAELRDPASGRHMTVLTDQPCVQVYTANMVNPDDPAFAGGVRQYRHCAVALETQAMPDSINHEGFTPVVLHPGEVYDRTTVFDFSKA